MEMYVFVVVVFQFIKLNVYILYKGLNILVFYLRGGLIKLLVNFKKLNIDRSICMYMCKWLCVWLMMKNVVYLSFVKYFFFCVINRK